MNANALRTYWSGRSAREQRLLLVMLALLMIVLAWLLVVRPLSDALASAKERHGIAVAELAEVRAQVEQVRAGDGAAPVALGAPLEAYLSRSATEAGFTPSRVDREGPRRATIAIEAVTPQAFFGWVGRMEATRGMDVERLTATPNADSTLSVLVTFRAKGV